MVQYVTSFAVAIQIAHEKIVAGYFVSISICPKHVILSLISLICMWESLVTKGAQWYLAHVERASISDSSHDSDSQGQGQGQEEINANECVNASASDMPHVSQGQGEEEIDATK
jgi:hypothetical protein